MSSGLESTEAIELRAIIESDIPGFRDCLDSVARERKYLAQLKAPSLDRVAEFVMEALRRGEVRIVAIDSSRVVGWCDITPHHWEGLDHVGELGMGVLREYRRKGIGRNLLQTALDMAQEIGMEKVELDVFASNRAAIELYEEAGFVVEGRRIKSRKLDEKYDDIVEMGLFLPSR
jgi:ribosomal protein S18 acetylase RimI-like enzyme